MEGRKEVGGDNVKKISSDITEMKKRKMEREKKNKKLREELTKIVNLNKKYCEEIKKLKKENKKLKKTLQERERLGLKWN